MTWMLAYTMYMYIVNVLCMHVHVMLFTVVHSQYIHVHVHVGGFDYYGIYVLALVAHLLNCIHPNNTPVCTCTVGSVS